MIPSLGSVLPGRLDLCVETIWFLARDELRLSWIGAIVYDVAQGGGGMERIRVFSSLQYLHITNHHDPAASIRDSWLFTSLSGMWSVGWSR